MIIARWQIEAKFGHKQAVIDSMKKWNETFGVEVGWTAEKVRVTTGSVGAYESLVVSEVTLENLSELDRSFAKFDALEGHAAWSAELEPHVVSGTNRWEVFRVL